MKTFLMQSVCPSKVSLIERPPFMKLICRPFEEHYLPRKVSGHFLFATDKKLTYSRNAREQEDRDGNVDCGMYRIPTKLILRANASPMFRADIQNHPQRPAATVKRRHALNGMHTYIGPEDGRCT